MEEKKVKGSDLIRLRRTMRLHGLATPVTSNVPTTTGVPCAWPSDAAQRDHKERGEQHASQLHDLVMGRKAQIQNKFDAPESIAKPWKKPWDE